MLATKFTKIEGHKLRYFTLGQRSNTPLLLLHGYPDNLQVWHKIAPMLAEKYFVLGIDWPGMGYSDDSRGGATPLAKAKKIRTIIAHFELEKVNILAQDMGGQAALVFAAEFPECVHQVWVMNSLLMWNEKTSWEIELLRKFKFNQFIIAQFPRQVFWRAVNTFVSDPKSISKELRQDLWTSFQTKPVRKYIVRMCAGYEAQLNKLPDYYQKITCPVHLIWAEDGKHFSVGHAHRFQEICQQTKVSIVEGAAHWMVLEQPEQIARLVRQ